MALNSSLLAADFQTAFLAASVDVGPTAEKTLANALAMAIHNFVKQADVKTVDTGICIGGINSATPLNAGPITVPANVTATGVGVLT